MVNLWMGRLQLTGAIALGLAGLIAGAAAAAPSTGQTLKPGEIPAGLTAPEWRQIEEAVAASRYRVAPMARDGAHAGTKASASALKAFNPAQRFQTEFGRSGVALTSSQDGTDWRLPVRLEGYGYRGASMPVADAAPTGSGDRVEYRRGEVTEWYVNTRSGLEQGFTLAHAPAAPAGAKSRSTLELALAVGGGFEPRAEKDGVALAQSHGGAVIHYRGLVATDASGRRLPARMAVLDRRIVLRIESQGARFPIVVDPTFTQQAELTGSDGAAADLFGQSVAVSGDTALVGAKSHAVGANSGQGGAYVFTRSGTTWTQQAELTSSDGAVNDAFGTSVALDGDTAVVGASIKTVGANSVQGAAYVFTRTGTSWTQQAELTGSDGAVHDRFGQSVAVSGDTVVVGAFIKTVGANNDQGAAYVFTRSGTSWTQQQELTSSDGAANDGFGVAVAVSGDTAVVGAFVKTVGANSQQGAAYVFTRAGTSWTQQQELTGSDGAVNDQFGRSVALDGDTAVVGADGKTVGANSLQGAAYVFTRAGTAWTEQQELTGSDGAASDEFGFSVAVSGDTAMAGAGGKMVGANSGQGAAYVFTRAGTAWTQQQELTISDGAVNDDFGIAVAVSGDTAVVGADGRTVGANSFQGAAYVFAPPPPAPVPTLGPWTLAILAGLMGAAGLVFARRRNPAASASWAAREGR